MTAQAKVIAFTNQKGGVAKTTTTLNLAAAFAEKGHRVLCVDMDPQGNLTMSQGIDPDSLDASMYDVLVHHIPIRNVIHKREVDVACASIDLAGAEIAMSTQIGRERSLQKAFAEKGHRVLCVDLDPQGNLTMSQGIDPETLELSMFDVLVHDLPIREVTYRCEIDVAVASIDLAGAEMAMSMKIGRERSLDRALRAIREDYDFVCIDTPPSLGLLTVNALTAADKVIVPVQCEYLSMRGLLQLQNTLSMIRENLNPDVQIAGILPTMVDTRTLHAKEALEILEENFGDRVFGARIRKTVRFAEAPVKGMSVLKYDPNGTAADAYRQLAKEVLSNG